MQMIPAKSIEIKYLYSTAKNIDMIDVQDVFIRDNVDGKVWGTSPGQMDTWFALDNERHLKQKYIQLLLKDSDVKPCFSPSDPEKVMSIIKTNSAMLNAKKQMNLNVPEKDYIKTEQKMPLVDKPFTEKPLINQNVLQPVYVNKPEVQQKGWGQSIKQKINQKIEGIKNIGHSAKEKYEEGKMNAYVSPDNKIDLAKQNAMLQAGQKTKQAGQQVQHKGKKMQYESYRV